MSYEGSYVFVCRLWHLCTREVYSGDVQSGPVCSMPPEHEGLVDVYEERGVLELDQQDWNIAMIDEETCEKHEWNDQDRGQSHSQLLI